MIASVLLAHTFWMLVSVFFWMTSVCYWLYFQVLERIADQPHMGSCDTYAGEIGGCEIIIGLIRITFVFSI